MKLKVLFLAVASLSSPLDEKIPDEAPDIESAEVDLVRLFAASIKLAEYGGQALVEAHTAKTVNVLSKQSGGVAEVVTNADLESNKRMSFSFPKLFPGVHVRSEEVTDEPIGRALHSPVHFSNGLGNQVRGFLNVLFRTIGDAIK